MKTNENLCCFAKFYEIRIRPNIKQFLTTQIYNFLINCFKVRKIKSAKLNLFC